MPEIKEFYELDFDPLKQDFKDFISSKTEFQDYNFDGSALSQLLDIITYSIQYQQTYLNMVVNELFLDTAQIDTNVFKLAAMLNYLPRRKTSAYISVELQRINDVLNGEIWEGAGAISPPDLPEDWVHASGVSNGYFSIVDDSANDPDRDTVLEIEEDAGGAVLLTQAIATNIGQNYTFTIWYRRDVAATQNAQILVGITDLGGEYYNSGPLTSTIYDQVSVNFTATNATTYITFGAFNSVLNDKLYFDAARLTQNVSILYPKYSPWNMGTINLTNVEDISIADNEIHEVRLYEGTVEQETFLSDGTDFQTYSLEYRDEVEQNNLSIFVDDSDGGSGFILSTDAWINVNVEAFQVNDNGYYLQHFETLNIKFDNGERFPKPIAGQQIRAVYIKSQGEEVNGDGSDPILLSTSVTNADKITINRNDNVLVNGVIEESVTSIRINAPLYFTTQNRAVTEDDHNILVKRYPQYETFFDAYLWGGEKEYVEDVGMEKRIIEIGPKKEFPYIDVGHVYVTALKENFDYLNQTEIDDLIDFLEITKIIAIFFRFLHPQIVRITNTVNIKHEAILNFSPLSIAERIDVYLDGTEGFNQTFHLSNLIKFVDAMDEVVETSIAFTSKVTVKDQPYTVVRLWNEINPNSISGSVGGFPFIDDGAGLLLWNGSQVGTVTYETGFLTINQEDYIDMGLAPDSTYDLDFTYTSQRTVELNRESFMFFEPIILVTELYEETE